jgi:hypothetical protein
VASSQTDTVDGAPCRTLPCIQCGDKVCMCATVASTSYCSDARACLYFTSTHTRTALASQNASVRVHAIKAYGAVEVYLHSFLNSVPDSHEWSYSRPGRFTTPPPGELAPRNQPPRAPRPVCAFWRRQQSISAAKIRISIRSLCSPQHCHYATELPQLPP